MEIQLASLIRHLENDFNRFPLPICFDTYSERREMYRRTCRIQEIAERYLSIQKLKK